MFYRSLFLASALTLLLCAAGCSSTASVAKLKGSGTSRVYPASYEQVWKAALWACENKQIRIVKKDEAAGTIIGCTPMTLETWGENVAIWITKNSEKECSVEVVSRHGGTHAVWNYNWEKPVLDLIEHEVTPK